MSDDRERLGRLVREVWVDWAVRQPGAKPSWLTPWSQLDDGQREVDMRIGEAVAADERERIIATLRRAADGRREYAGTATDVPAVLMRGSAHGLEEAIALLADPALLLDIIPSWRWTEAEHKSVREQS